LEGDTVSDQMSVLPGRPWLDTRSLVGDWLAHPEGGPLLLQALKAMDGSAVATDPQILRMVESLPLNRLVAMSGGRLRTGGLDQLLDRGAACS
jgi:beta-glucosidase